MATPGKKTSGKKPPGKKAPGGKAAGKKAPGKKRAGKTPLATVSARLSGPVALQAHADGKLVLCFEGGYGESAGTVSPQALPRVSALRTGLPLAALFEEGRTPADNELGLLVRRLARRGLIVYGVAGPDGAEIAVIEPQTPAYRPREALLADGDTVVLSRFAYLRRRGATMVLESPRAGALFELRNSAVAAVVAMLAEPRKIRQLHLHEGFPGMALLALMADCDILFKVEAPDQGLRPAEGDGNLVLWDFHDLLFHARSTAGRHANPLGGVYPYAGVMAALPAVRPHWPGMPIDLDACAPAAPPPPVAGLLRARRSVRVFDDRHPITLAELAQFLGAAARVLSVSKIDDGDGPAIEVTSRPYPSAGSAYELELYLAASGCAGLEAGFFHYDAGAHALTAIDAAPQELGAMLGEAQFAMGVEAPPQVLITIAARFGRLSWKYASIAYALLLKDVGVLTQTLYLVATDMGLGGCATGITNTDLFARMTGLAFHVEGPVGQFALGRAAPAHAAPGAGAHGAGE